MPTAVYIIPVETSDGTDTWQPNPTYVTDFVTAHPPVATADQYAEGIPPALIGVAELADNTLLAADTALPVEVTIPDPPAPPPPPAPTPSIYAALATAAGAATTLAELQAAVVAFAEAHG
jgi:hypothetical protein